jgi:ATP-dependent Zn protease
VDLFASPPIIALQDCNFDLLWMAVHMDDCDHYTNVRDLNQSGMKLVDTIAPNGALCILFTPEGKEKFLSIFSDHPVKKATITSPRTLASELKDRVSNNKNEKDKFRAVTPFPSLVDFNIFARTDNKELIRTVRCKDSTKSKNMTVKPSSSTSSTSSSGLKEKKVEKVEKVEKEEAVKANKNSVSMSFFWFIIVIIIVLFIAYFLIKMTAKKNDTFSYTTIGTVNR